MPLLPWPLQSALEPVVTPHHEPPGSGVHGVSEVQTGRQLSNTSVGGSCQAAHAGCPVQCGEMVCLMGEGETLQGAAPLQGWLLCLAARIGADADLSLGRVVGKGAGES